MLIDSTLVLDEKFASWVGMTLLQAEFTDADFLDGILSENIDGNYEINFKLKNSEATLNDILIPIPL